jgi:hypothetical protein
VRVGEQNLSTRSTMAALAIMEADAEAISKRAVELALAGDLTAIRLVLDRLVSPARDRPIHLALPKINAASDLIAAASALTEATAASKGTSSAEGCLERAREYPKRRSNSRSRSGRDGHRFEKSARTALICSEIAARMLASVSRGARAPKWPMSNLAMIAEDLGHAPAGVEGVAREDDDGRSAKSSHFHDCSVPIEVKCGGQKSRQ